MAKNLVFRNDNKKNRAEDLGLTLDSGVPVLSLSGAPAVTLTASADFTRSEVIPGVGTLSGIAAGGASLEGQEVSLAFDGTWEFPEADIAGTTAATAEQGDAIYITDSNALTTTEGSNTFYGSVDFPVEYDKTRGFVPVKIGAR